jgi:hypothetical protein
MSSASAPGSTTARRRSSRPSPCDCAGGSADASRASRGDPRNVTKAPTSLREEDHGEVLGCMDSVCRRRRDLHSVGPVACTDRAGARRTCRAGGAGGPRVGDRLRALQAQPVSRRALALPQRREFCGRQPPCRAPPRVRSGPGRAAFGAAAPALGATSLAFGIWYAAAAWNLAPYPL